MKPYFWATVMSVVCTSLVLFSCQPRVIEVNNNSVLEEVTLSMEKSDTPWLVGEERMITVTTLPATAHISELTLSVSDESLVSLQPVKDERKYVLTALAPGEIEITAKATAGEGEEERVATTSEKYTISVIPNQSERPVVSITLINGTDVMTIEENRAFSVSSDNALKLSVSTYSPEDYQYSLTAESSDIISLTRKTTTSWEMKTNPGKSMLTLSVIDASGKEHVYRYLCYSFAHINVTIESDPINGTCGFSVSGNRLQNLSGMVTFGGKYIGHGGKNDKTSSCILDPYSGYLDFSKGLFRSLVSFAAERDFVHLQLMKGGVAATEAEFNLELRMEVELNDKYIILEGPYYASDGNDQLQDYTLSCVLVQEGIAEVRDPDGNGTPPGGWGEQEITINL